MINKKILVIPLVVFTYILYMNLLPFGSEINFEIDIGSEGDMEGAARLAGPFERISGPEIEKGITFRKLKNDLVYFDLISPYLKERGNISVKVTFKDNFPAGEKFIIGARNNETWNYLWEDIYVPFFEKLKKYPYVSIDGKTVFIINSKEIESFDEIPEGSVIATNTEILQNSYMEIPGNSGREYLKVDVSMRDSHTVYTNVKDSGLNINISKQDLNWYKGGDELKIELYNDNELIDKGTIPDDGDKDKSSIQGEIQKGIFSFSGLKPGVYRIELITESDLLIREIELDSGKFVVGGKLFLTGNTYFKDEDIKPVEVYFKNPGNSTLKFITWHDLSLQNIIVKNEMIEKSLNITETNKWYNLSLGRNEEINTLIYEKGNIITDSTNYFSFTKDSYFEPEKYRILDLKPDMEWINGNFDYVIIDYRYPEGNEWKTSESSWDLDDLFLKDNKLSFGLNIPHLNKDEFQNYTIPVEKIEIKVTIPPIWKRIS